MTSNPSDPGRFSLRRWSQRKLDVARAEPQPSPQAREPAAATVTGSPTPALAGPRAGGALETAAPAMPATTELPPIESLTIESDFTPFFKPQVDQAVQRAALKQLFRDPRFNVMDGLDTYIGDYTQPDPIPGAMLAKLMERRVSFALPAAEADAVERDPRRDPIEAVSPLSPPAAPVSDATAVTPEPARALASPAAGDPAGEAVSPSVRATESDPDMASDKS